MPVTFVAAANEVDYANYRSSRRYHFCCLGLIVRLPLVRACRTGSPVVMGGVIPQIIVNDGEEMRLGITSP
jgi:hypothetical protein